MSDEPTHYVKPVYAAHNDGYKSVGSADNPPLSAPAETHKRSEKVTTVTIEFERMPGIRRPVRLTFYRHGDNNRGWVYDNGMIVFLNNHREPQYKAACHPSDTFSWEIGMRLCVKRIGNPTLYRAFRRWMWLAEAAHVCHHNDSCRLCPAGHAPILLCRPKQMNDIIAREFGRVEVSIA